jgi:hypothetical protein
MRNRMHAQWHNKFPMNQCCVRQCRFPWWWHTKLAFLLWLQLPTFQVGVNLHM